jgi:hypothetical protein
MPAAPFSPWELNDYEARLRLGLLDARTDVRAPYSGLTTSLGTSKLKLFRVELPPAKDERVDAAPECYVRGPDLVSTYVQDERRQIRGQVYWRAFEWGESRASALELIVSVQTSLLDSDPTLHVRSQVTAGELLNIKSYDPPAARADTPRGSDNFVVKYEGRGPACWLLRLSSDELTYAEMVHPSDFVASSFQEISPGLIEHSTRLFRGPLEKGVILRSRLRGVLLPRSDDVALAAACYREFTASQPPLTV